MVQEQLLITAVDVKNELGIDIGVELGIQPAQVERWLARVQRTIINHIASYAYGGLEEAERRVNLPQNKTVMQRAILEQIDYLAANNFVQADKVMKTGAQVAEPVIAPLAHQMLLNAGLLYTGACV